MSDALTVRGAERQKLLDNLRQMISKEENRKNIWSKNHGTFSARFQTSLLLGLLMLLEFQILAERRRPHVVPFEIVWGKGPYGSFIPTRLITSISDKISDFARSKEEAYALLAQLFLKSAEDITCPIIQKLTEKDAGQETVSADRLPQVELDPVLLAERN